MDNAVFSELAGLALKHSGQVLPPQKAALAEARLTSLLRREGFANVAELLSCLELRDHEAMTRETVARLCSRESWFFRDRTVLSELVNKFLPARIIDRGEEKLRVWCAGVAAGQEAYSLAILLSESELLQGRKVELLATDLCPEMIGRTRTAAYSHFEIQRGLSTPRMLAHFRPCQDGSWQAQRALRERVAVRQHNLLDPMDGFGQFDAILCRNTIGTMSRNHQGDVLQRLSACLKPGGRLLLGLDEQVAAIHQVFETDGHRPGFYITPADAEAEAAAA